MAWSSAQGDPARRSGVTSSTAATVLGVLSAHYIGSGRLLSFFKISMSHSGRRAGSGRKRTGANKLDTIARKAAMEICITPLEFMLAILRNEANSDAVRMEAAKAAAPYVHARLAHIEKETELTVSFVARLPSAASSVEAWLEARRQRLSSSR